MPRKELSFDAIRGLLERALNAGVSKSSTDGPRYWVKEVYPDAFIYTDSRDYKLYRRPYVIAGDDDAVTLGDAVEVIERATYEPVVSTSVFSITDVPVEDADGYVTRKGKIFEAGEYKDKQFSITAEELKDVVKTFEPVEVDYAHVPGPLDGKLGRLTAIELAENGKDVLGVVSLPKWLDKALGEAPRKVSCTWNRATKRLEKLALVNNPRITDAVLMAAFTADFEGRRNSAADLAALQTIHDHCAQLGAECQFTEKQEANYSLTEVKNQMTEPNKTTAPATPPAETVQDNAAFTAEFAAMRAELAALKNANETLKAENRRTQAQAFADAEIKAGRAYPVERAAMVAAFEQAAKDDGASPATITFAEGQTGSRVDALKALYAARPASALMSGGQRVELSAAQVQAAFGSATNGSTPQGQQDVSKERVEELKGMTVLGIAAKNN